MSNNSHLEVSLAELRKLRDKAEKARTWAEQTIADTDAGIRVLEAMIKRQPAKTDEDDVFLDSIFGPSVEESLPTAAAVTAARASLPEPQTDDAHEFQGTAASRILGLLRQSPQKTFTVKEIQAAIGPVTSRQLHGSLWRLSNDSGKISNVGRGKYKLKA